MKYSGIGGQAVLEGVMMKNKEKYAVAVRKPDGEITVDTKEYYGLIKNKTLRNIPILRGVLSFVESLTLGISTLTYSASFFEEDEEDTKAKKKELSKEAAAKKEKAEMGITVTFVSPDCTEEELNAAFQDNTRAVFGETIANPALTVLDIEKFAKAAHAHGVPLIVDNTFPTPVNCRPIEWGADIVTHSTTKYMDGHGAAVGGAIVDSGKFDWMAHADKFPGLCTPDESYHGITYAEKFGKEGAFITKCTAQLMRDFGCIQSPQHAFLLNLGLESLHVRMPRHVENGQAVAEFLQEQPQVSYVNYSGLPTDCYYTLAQKYLPNGGCGVVSFELKGGRAAAEKFMKNLKLAAIETHVADARTCCLNPATSTHRQMTDEQLEAAGVPAGLVRISCGLEDKADLIADLKQALEAID